jgi:hypothetical protein
MRGAIPPLSNTSSWHGAQLSTETTLHLRLPPKLPRFTPMQNKWHKLFQNVCHDLQCFGKKMGRNVLKVAELALKWGSRTVDAYNPWVGHVTQLFWVGRVLSSQCRTATLLSWTLHLPVPAKRAICPFSKCPFWRNKPFIFLIFRPCPPTWGKYSHLASGTKIDPSRQ